VPAEGTRWLLPPSLAIAHYLLAAAPRELLLDPAVQGIIGALHRFLAEEVCGAVGDGDRVVVHVDHAGLGGDGLGDLVGVARGRDAGAVQLAETRRAGSRIAVGRIIRAFQRRTWKLFTTRKESTCSTCESSTY